MTETATVLSSWLFDSGSWADETARILGDVAIMGVALFLMAFAANLVLRKATASMRHWIWISAFSGLLILPVLSVVLPRWTLPIVPVVEKTNEGPVESLKARPDSLMTAVPQAITTTSSESGNGDDGALIIPASSLRSIADNLLGDLPEKAGRVSLRARQQMDMLNWPAIVLVLWFGISIFLVLKLLISIVRVAAISRSADRLEEPEWWASAKEVAADLQFEREFEIRWSPRVRSPLTWGCRQPVLLLPATAPEWDDERRTIVLVHELAHVKRCDWVIQVGAHVIACFHWFNPLVWLGFRKLRLEHERACDDHVLRWGVSPATYAEHLVEIARSFWTARWVSRSSVGMARKSQLEGRVVSILDPAQRRGVSKPVGRLLIVAVLALALISIVTIRPVSTSSNRASAARAEDGAFRFDAISYSLGGPIHNVETADQVCRDMSETYGIDGSTSVVLKNTYGSVQIVGWDKDAIRVDAATCAYAIERLVEASVVVKRKAGLVSIESAYENQEIDWSKRPDRLERKPATITYTVSVPRDTDLDLVRLSHGNVHIKGVSGTMTAEVASGDAIVEGVRQNASIASVDGTVRADLGRLKTGSTVRISSVNGPIRVTLPADTDAQVRARSVAGTVDNEFGYRDRRRSRSRLSRMMGFGRSAVLIESINGPIKIQRATAEARAYSIETKGEREDALAYASTTNEYIEQLRDPDSRIRARAARVLGRMQNPAAVPALIEASEDEDWVVRVEVASALGRIEHPKARERLEELKDDCNATVRRRARRALRSSEGQDRFEERINRGRSDVDMEMIEEIQGLGIAAEEFGVQAAEVGIEVLRDVIADVVVELGDNHVNIRVNEQDVELGAEEVREVLAQLDERFSRWSARALADMQEGKVAFELRQAARRARKDVERASRRAEIEFLEALADLPDGRGVPRLKEVATEHDDLRVRRSAVALLKTIDHPRARRALHDLQ